MPPDRSAPCALARVLAACAAIVCAAAAHAQESRTPAASQAVCLVPASWHDITGAKPRALAEAEVLASMARRDVVLLGEHHDDPDHHHWQLQTLAALHALRPNMVIGFEAFPRRVQRALDQWTAGALTTKQFLERVEWEKVWNVSPELYLPLFHFARLNRVPMIALNVERALTEAIASKGWDAVPAERKEGISKPARPAPAYEDFLFDVFKQHARPERRESAAPNRADSAFRFFVESQTTWDRAMAEALAARLKAAPEPRPLVVGIMGAGHVRFGYGVPHQLRELGVSNIGMLLPVSSAADCAELKPKLADAVFAIPAMASEKPPPPRLGIRLESADGAVRIAMVSAGSLAEQTGLRVGDRIVSIAGHPVSGTSSVASAITSQPAGTWLPIQIRRGDNTIDLVIKFPPRT